MFGDLTEEICKRICDFKCYKCDIDETIMFAIGS